VACHALAEDVWRLGFTVNAGRVELFSECFCCGSGETCDETRYKALPKGWCTIA